LSKIFPDASYFKVGDSGYYYLVMVMDDYSRFILGWKLQKDISANSLIEVVKWFLLPQAQATSVHTFSRNQGVLLVIYLPPG
jgi:transposase InsO family protein